ncbi:MAG: preprotein translocase subunit SecG [Planctomycetes bacterium]|nr:preprotein translocase subunit SecG [Planctomycetota bacterium]
MVLPLALSFVWNLMVALFILVCVSIILIVLLQKGRGGGIGAAFGGGGAGSLLGTKTGDFLTWVTICLVAMFLVLAVLMGKFMRPEMSADLSSQTAAPVAPVETDIAMPITETPDAAATESVSAETLVVDEAASAVDEVAEDAVETLDETK